MSSAYPVHVYREMLITGGATATNVDALIAAAKREAREEAAGEIAKLLIGKLEAADRDSYVAPARASAKDPPRKMTLPRQPGATELSLLDKKRPPPPPPMKPCTSEEPWLPPDVPTAPLRKPVSSWSRAWRGFWQVKA